MDDIILAMRISTELIIAILSMKFFAPDEAPNSLALWLTKATAGCLGVLLVRGSFWYAGF
jgi:hypothetical protein